MFVSKSHLQLNPANWVSRLTRDNSMENSVGCSQIFISQPHALKGLVVKDVDATTPIHEHLDELIPTNLRRHYQSQLTQVIDPRRMILPASYDGLL